MQPETPTGAGAVGDSTPSTTRSSNSSSNLASYARTPILNDQSLWSSRVFSFEFGPANNNSSFQTVPVGPSSGSVSRQRSFSIAHSPASSLFNSPTVRPMFHLKQAAGVEKEQVFTVSPPETHIICISNIPWDLLTKDVLDWLKPYNIVEFGVHILMERSTTDGARTTGKTLSDAYVEFELESEALDVVQKMKRAHLKGRQVTVRMASKQELTSRLFPNWAIGNNNNSPDAALQSDSLKNSNIYLTREEINAILMVCKNYKLHFSRKCADRPFENIISIVAKIPWDSPDKAPGLMHRDHVFEMLKLSIDILCLHVSKDYYHVSDDLLTRLVRVGLKCPGFTERQKQGLLTAAEMECPEELEEYLTTNYQTAAGPHMRQPTEAETQSVINDLPIGLKSLSFADVAKQSNETARVAVEQPYQQQQQVFSPPPPPGLPPMTTDLNSQNLFQQLMAERQMRRELELKCLELSRRLQYAEAQLRQLYQQ